MTQAKSLRVTLALILCLSLAACASFEKNAYRTVGATVTAVDLAMETYGELYRAGKTTPAQDAKVRAVYGDYQIAVAGAKAAIDVYKSSGDQAALSRALGILAAAAAAVEAEVHK